MVVLFKYIVILSIPSMVFANGLLLLYRPKDITHECAFSKYLRFDISFGMGMSDTITMLFRTLNDIDYECLVEIVASSPEYLLVVVRYPTTIISNCEVNRDALTILKKWRCTRLCDLLDREVYSPYFVFTVKQRLRFLFKSNSSINLDLNVLYIERPVPPTNLKNVIKSRASAGKERIVRVVDAIGTPKLVINQRRIFPAFNFIPSRMDRNPNLDIHKANFYQVTITSARMAPKRGCYKRNETVCTVDQINYCFTTGVVCDGIKNCGVDDWFDERKARCALPVEKLGYAPVIAVVVVLLCAFVAGSHALLRCLPSHAQSFFIFNANEDNRLCIDPILVPRGHAPDIEPFKQSSLIPVFGSLSSDSDTFKEEAEVIELENIKKANEETVTNEKMVQELDETSEYLPYKPESTRKSTMKSMSEKLQDKFKIVARYAALARSSREPERVLQA